MTFINIEAYKKLNDKYIHLIEHHATAIYNHHAESEFAYFITTRELSDLESRFDREVAKDIFTKVIDMARADKFVNKDGIPYLQGGKDE